MRFMPKQKGLTAQDLIDNGVSYTDPRDALRGHLLQRINEADALQDLFPNTVLEDDALECLVSALVSRGHVLLFGPSGSGKTSLAKDVWGLYPKEIYAVEGCPVQDSPFSLISDRVARLAPPCPFCRASPGDTGPDAPGGFRPEDVDPASVPVRRTTLREGYGFARIQGSSEVFPDYLTGNINIHKLEEIGDPESPLVLEPGKLLQANRGMLLIDEVGKLPLGTQNVLLQALQEGIVTPAKSRETFPARFTAICTSNIADLDNINEPLNDRLISVNVPFNRSHAKNRHIVEMAYTPGAFMPEPFLDAAVGLIERWRGIAGDHPDLSEVGSNRSMIDMVLRTEAFVLMRGGGYPNREDFERGVREAMIGRVRTRGVESFEQNAATITEFLGSNLGSELARWAKVCWCRFFRHIDERRDTAEGVLRDFRKLKEDPAMLSRIGGSFSDLALFVEYCQKIYSCGPEEAVHMLDVLDSTGIFDGEPDCGATRSGT